MPAEPGSGSAATRPFVDRPITDVPAARSLAARVAAESGLAAPTLLHHGMNCVFRCGDLALRVSHLNGPPGAAYELADALTAAGVRVARPAQPRLIAHGPAGSGLAVTGWQLVPTRGVVDWAEVGAMVRTVNGLDRRSLPTDYPIPSCTDYPWWRFDEIVGEVAASIDGPALAGIRRVIERHRGWIEASGGPESWVVCHGDVHPQNVIAGPAGPVIIDWDLLCLGPRSWDHAPLRSMIARWGARPAWYADFARGYGADLGDDPITVALTELRLVAATLLRVKAGRADAAARAEAERRLAYWRGDPTAPRWAMS